MPAKRKSDASPKESSSATIGFEAKLWLAAEGRAEGGLQKEDGVPRLHSSFLLPTFPVLANGSMSSNQSGEGCFASVFGMKTGNLSQRATA